MNSKIDTLFRNLYDEYTSTIMSVYEVFKDYFDEDRVDIQDLITYEYFKLLLKSRRYEYFLRNTNITSSIMYMNYPEEIKIIIRALLGEGALKTYIGEYDIISKYILPFLINTIDSIVSNVSILVHFPNVRVTNEYDNYIDIKDLYAKIKVTSKGNINGTFGLNRTDYPYSHIRADYMHSHVPGLNLNNTSSFKSPCLGSGPINDTILSLVRNYDLSLWMLFCRELDVYVRTESIQGVPYRRLENIHGGDSIIRRNISTNSAISDFTSCAPDILESFFINFIKYIIDNKIIKINYNGGSYNLGMSYFEYVLHLSNAYIKYVNTNINSDDSAVIPLKNLLEHCIIKDNVIYIASYGNNNNRYADLNGRSCFTFKGETKRLNVYNDLESSVSENNVLLLKDFFCRSLLFHIITYLNISYGKSENTSSETGFNKKLIVL